MKKEKLIETIREWSSDLFKMDFACQFEDWDEYEKMYQRIEAKMNNFIYDLMGKGK